MLTADAYGVLPPIARLTPDGAMYHFLSGYTARVAGTEKGVTEPKATFSTCFGAPFLPLNPNVYARMLGEKIAKHQARVWLVNTGWTGGPYGVGSRMKIAHTRAMITAALTGLLDNVEYKRHPIFNIDVPTTCPGVPNERARSARDLARRGQVRRAGDEARGDVRGKLQDVREGRRGRGERGRPAGVNATVRARHRARDPRPAPDPHEDLLRLQHRVRCCAELAGVPGLPRASRARFRCLNRQAVDYAIKAALALGCAIQPESIFARKNYFYPDLPKGYQISQYERPLALGGGLDITVDGASRRIGLTRIHMEEDAGKSLHEGFPDSDRRTYVDYNRSGVPLIEIVSEPDLRSAAEAAEFFARLRDILVWLGVNDGNMEEGSLRCDANVSVRPRGQATFGTKAEVKNVNSFRYVGKAIDYEIERQIERPRGRRPRRAGDAALGLGDRPHELDAQQGRGARLPVFPGARSARRWSWTRHVSPASSPRCPSCRRRAGAGSSRSMRFRSTTPAC